MRRRSSFGSYNAETLSSENTLLSLTDISSVGGISEGLFSAIIHDKSYACVTARSDPVTCADSVVSTALMAVISSSPENEVSSTERTACTVKSKSTSAKHVADSTKLAIASMENEVRLT